MMPRTARVIPPDSILHVFSRGVERRDIFLTDDDRSCFLSLLHRAFMQHGVTQFAYCLMGNHFHLLVAPREEALGRAMHQALTGYALYFNGKHDRVGHLFQNRFKSSVCENLAYLAHLASYIHLNPVRAGFVSKPASWPWSSHRSFLDGYGPFIDLSPLERLNGMKPSELQAHYRDRVEELEGSGAPSASLEELTNVAARYIGISHEGLLAGERGALYTKARRLVIRWAMQRGHNTGAIAEALRCCRSAVQQLRVHSPTNVP